MGAKSLKKTLLFTFALLLAIMSVLSSCSAPYKSNDSSADYEIGYNADTAAGMSNKAAYAPAEANAPAETSAYYDDGYAAEYGTELETYDSLSSTTSAQGVEYEKMIIKNADISLSAENVAECYSELLSFAKLSGGYEFSCDSSNSGEYSYIRAVLKIPPQNLDKFLSHAGDTAKLVSSNVYSNDISAQYYDSVTRLNTLRKSLDKYYEFLDATTSVKDMLAVQSEINALTLQIEAYEGNIKYWNSMVAEATVTIWINPVIPEKTGIEQKEIDWNAISLDDMIYLLKSGFMSVVNVIVTFLQWIVIIFISGLPVFIILAAVVIIIILRRRSKKKSKTDSGDMDDYKR